MGALWSLYVGFLFFCMLVRVHEQLFLQISSSTTFHMLVRSQKMRDPLLSPVMSCRPSKLPANARVVALHPVNVVRGRLVSANQQCTLCAPLSVMLDVTTLGRDPRQKYAPVISSLPGSIMLIICHFLKSQTCTKHSTLNCRHRR